MSPFVAATSILNSKEIRFRLIAHPAEGRTANASTLRRNSLREAAKSLLLRVGYSNPKRKRYFIAVVPGNSRANFNALISITNSQRIGFASDAELRRLTGCVSGAVPPLPYSNEVELIVDQSFTTISKMVFNIGRLDTSAEVLSADFIQKIPSRLACFSTPSSGH